MVKKILIFVLICLIGCSSEDRNYNLNDSFLSLECFYSEDTGEVIVDANTNIENTKLSCLNNQNFFHLIDKSSIFYDTPAYPGQYHYKLEGGKHVDIAEITKPMPIYATYKNIRIETNRLQNYFNSITYNYYSSINVKRDTLYPGKWKFKVGVDAVLMIEMAGFAPHNKFGIYNKEEMLTLFNGQDKQSSRIILKKDENNNIIFNGDSTDVSANGFGFWLDSSHYNRGGTLYDDEYMLAYQGKGDRISLPDKSSAIFSTEHFMLCWEDLAENPDNDFEDMVILISGIYKVIKAEPRRILR